VAHAGGAAAPFKAPRMVDKKVGVKPGAVVKPVLEAKAGRHRMGRAPAAAGKVKHPPP
jgi:hypothetical protein